MSNRITQCYSLESSMGSLGEEEQRSYKFYKYKTLEEGFKICDKNKVPLFKLEFGFESIILRRMDNEEIIAYVGNLIMDEGDDVDHITIGVFLSLDMPVSYTLSRSGPSILKLKFNGYNNYKTRFYIEFGEYGYKVQKNSFKIGNFTRKKFEAKEGTFHLKDSLTIEDTVAILMSLGISIYYQKYYKRSSMATKRIDKVYQKFYGDYLLPIFASEYRGASKNFLDLSFDI